METFSQDIVMEYIEQQAVASFPHSSTFWKWYVDCTCVAILPSMVESFHKHLNSIEPSIQFTVKTENDRQLAFLDINISRHSDGSLSISVYRKKTNTDQYLQFSSHHPLSHKQSVGCTLFSRASTHSSSLVQCIEEESHIYEALKRNGYPKTGDVRPPLSISNILNQDNATRVTMPYIQGQSEAIKGILSPLGIQTVFRPLTTLRKVLSKPKENQVWFMKYPAKNATQHILDRLAET